MNEKVDIAIIFPVFNPHQDWETNIIQTSLALENSFPNYSFLFILVNDGSTQEVSYHNFEKIKNFQIIDHPKNLGKGAAVKSGIHSIEAKYYIYTDYDLPFGYEPIIQMIKTFEKESPDVIISKRSDEYFEILPIGRKIISKLFILINYFLFKGKISDTQGGLKGYNSTASKILLSGTQNGFLFETESLLAMTKAGLRFKSVEANPKKGLVINNLHILNILKNCLELFKIVFLR